MNVTRLYESSEVKRAFSSSSLSPRNTRRAAEVFWRNAGSSLIGILCSSFTRRLFAISCFSFFVVYRWHNIITAKLSSVQSAICFSVMETVTPSARWLLLIHRELSRRRRRRILFLLSAYLHLSLYSLY